MASGLRTEEGFSNRLLILISSPLLQKNLDLQGDLRPVPPLELHTEIEAILKAFRETIRIQFDVYVEFVTTTSFSTIFNSEKPPLIVHFIGHALSTNGNVSFQVEGDEGIARLAGTEMLKATFRDMEGPPCKLAVLNACYSQELGDVFVDAGVEHVVAISAAHEILDVAARAFSKAFYPLMLSGKRVATAFAGARNAVAHDDQLQQLLSDTERSAEAEAVKYLLLPANSSHDSVEYEKMSGIVEWPEWENTNLAEARDPFIGRQHLMHSCAKQLRHPAVRCVSILGLPGMGKTALATAVGTWHHQRRRWKDGVWFIQMADIPSAERARRRIAAVTRLDAETAISDEQLSTAHVEKYRLLILDNIDLLLRKDQPGCISLINGLLGCRGVRIITTSRRKMPGQIVNVEIDVSAMSDADAQAAFKAYLVSPGTHGLSDMDNFEKVLNFLGGYPFPIRLAATYMKQTECNIASLRRQLEEEPFKTLIFPAQAEAEETSFRLTLQLAYRGLPPAASDAFRRLALFPGGLRDDVAEEVFGAEGVKAFETLLLYSMAEDRHENNFRRFSVPEPVRIYAKSLSGPELKDLLAPSCLQCLDQIVTSGIQMILDENEREDARLMLSLEEANILEFLEWGFENEKPLNGTLRCVKITALLPVYWRQSRKAATSGGWAKMALGFLNKALRAAQNSGDGVGEAQVHKAIGDAERSLGHYDIAEKSYTKAVEMRHSFSDVAGEGECYKALGEIYAEGRRTDKAKLNFALARKCYQMAPQPQGEVEVLRTMGEMYIAERDLELAEEVLNDALEIHKKMSPFSRGMARLHERIGDVQEMRGLLEKALSSYLNARNIFNMLRSKADLISVQRKIENLGGE